MVLYPCFVKIILVPLRDNVLYPTHASLITCPTAGCTPTVYRSTNLQHPAPASPSPCRPSWWRCRARWDTSESGYPSYSEPRLPRSCPSVPYRPSHPAQTPLVKFYTLPLKVRFYTLPLKVRLHWRSGGTWCLGRPTMEGKTARGASSPANPALHIPEPLSTTRAEISSSISTRTQVWFKTK